MVQLGRERVSRGGDIHLYLVRHGQTEWNLERRLQGQLDSPLTEIGQVEAKKVGQRLAGLGVNRLVGSDLGRTQQTAKRVSEALSETLGSAPMYETNEGFRERNLGRLQGRRVLELTADEAEEYDACRFGDPEYRPQGGEARLQLAARGMASLTSLVAQLDSGQSAAVISHGGLLGAVLGNILGIPIDVRRAFYVANCAFHHLVYRRGRFEVLTLGDVSHLAE